jgi:ribosome maturation factor RimP
VPAKPPDVLAKAKPLPSYGRVRFDDLERAVGRTVAVETRFGTRRVGKVTAFNRAAVTIDINEKGTSLPLTVPRGTVLSIELVSPESG